MGDASLLVGLHWHTAGPATSAKHAVKTPTVAKPVGFYLPLQHPPLLLTGALEYNPAGLNRTWFYPQPAKGQIPGDHWHAIYAASFKPTGTAFPLAWSPEDNTVPGVDVTQAYIDAAVLPPSPSSAAAAVVEGGGLSDSQAAGVKGEAAAEPAAGLAVQ